LILTSTLSLGCGRNLRIRLPTECPRYNLGLVGLIEVDLGPPLDVGLSFACVPRHSCDTALAVGIRFLWCMWFAVRSLVSITPFVAANSIHASVIAFCHCHHLVPGISWSELGLNIAP